MPANSRWDLIQGLRVKMKIRAYFFENYTNKFDQTLPVFV